MSTNFWELLQQHQGDLTKSGRTVAEYLVQHAAEAQYLSISSLARECQVAEATVFRFCRALGFEGYHEMRIALAQANATGVLVNQQEPAPDADTATLCEHASALFMTAINGTQNALSPQAVEQALLADSSIKAVLLTSPNYYGIAADVQAIAAICHAQGAVLLVDEAHGPHLGFSELLPPSALQCGADACAQSTHKILGAMTQCSLLHVQGKHLDLQRAADVMSILTTTSPNYLLMGSLDAARAQVQAYGREMSEAAAIAAQKLRNLCRAHAGLRVLEEEDCGGLRLDTTKVTVNFAGWGYTGVEVGDALRKARIAVELVDAYNVLFLVTYADNTTDYTEMLARVEQVFCELEAHKRAPQQLLAAARVPQTQAVLPLRDVFYRKKQAVPLAQAVGKICGEQVSFYPPGIPVLLPGELVTEEIIAYCAAQKALGLPVSGPADSSLQMLRIIEN